MTEPQEAIDQAILEAAKQAKLERFAECEIGTSDHSEHDRRITELRSQVDLMHSTPRSLVAKITAQKAEIDRLNRKLKRAYSKIEEHLKKHKEGVYGMPKKVLPRFRLHQRNLLSQGPPHEGRMLRAGARKRNH